MENIVIENNEEYSISNINADPFLRIFNYIYNSENPLSRTDIRNNLKHDLLRQILLQLNNAGVFYEHRTDANRTSYVLPFERKDELINCINNNIVQNLEKSNSIADKAHLSMIQNGYSIATATSDIQIKTLKNKNEIQLVKMLYTDIKKYSARKLGRSFDYIQTSIFKNNQSIAKSTIISLVNKGIIKCSRRNHFFLNNQVLENIKAILPSSAIPTIDN